MMQFKENASLKSEFEEKFIRYFDIIADIKEGSKRIESIVTYLRQFSHHVKSYLENGKNFVIEFNDNGIGMNQKVKEKIFEPFFTTKEVGVGTGMGMAIAFGIIEKHNGKISIESEEGIGSQLRLFYRFNGAKALEILKLLKKSRNYL